VSLIRLSVPIYIDGKKEESHSKIISNNKGSKTNELCGIKSMKSQIAWGRTLGGDTNLEGGREM
jgi:hypothetical protein